jgi:hypothetical protein
VTGRPDTTFSLEHKKLAVEGLEQSGTAADGCGDSRSADANFGCAWRHLNQDRAALQPEIAAAGLETEYGVCA